MRSAPAHTPRRPNSRRRILHRIRTDQRGQSLIVVSLAMVVVLGVCAMAIDVASWYQKHHQAQVIADAAALAAANCLANPNTGPSGSQCTSGTDTTDATTVADNYAVKNGLPATDLNVSFSGSQVKVTATNTAPAFFANLIGIHTATQVADATAGWQSGASDQCSSTTPSAQCSAVYAASTTCSGSSAGIWFGSGSAGATVTVTGGVHSQGQLGFGSAGGTYTASSMTVTSSCYSSSDLPTEYGKTMATLGASESWPVNYAASPYFTACSGNCVTVNGIANVPPYCTDASTSSSGFDFVLINNEGEVPYSGHVYCAIGSGTASNPATWNGPITVSENLGMSGSTCSGAPDVTLIGGSVTFTDSATCLDANLDNCLAYATTGNIEFYNGTYDWTGTLFAPNGAIDLGVAGSGNDTSTATGLIEGLNVSFQNTTLTLTGSGPPASGSSSSASGTDSLEQ